MIVSTKGRYALRVLTDLAEQEEKLKDPKSDKAPRIPLKEIAERQHISQKYIEAIMTLLSKHGFVDAVHGKGGGYRLNRKPEEYRIGDILRITEGTLAPVACLDEGKPDCGNKNNCRTFFMWTKLDKLIEDFLDGVTIKDLMQGFN